MLLIDRNFINTNWKVSEALQQPRQDIGINSFGSEIGFSEMIHISMPCFNFK